MEERKTAAVVLGILAVIVIFFFVILPKIKHSQIQTVSFKKCAIHFKFSHVFDHQDSVLAENKLALCLCDLYKIGRDPTIATKIVSIYNLYDSAGVRGRQPIDSILKRRNYFLDTSIVGEE